MDHSSARLIQSTILHHITLKPILILSSHVRLALKSSLYRYSKYMHLVCPIHFNLDFITLIIIYEKYNLRISLCNFPGPAGSTILVSQHTCSSTTLYSNVSSLRSSITVGDTGQGPVVRYN
jgi:hypothetical protein